MPTIVDATGPGFWIAALAPLGLLLYLLVGRHWKAGRAAPVAYAVAVLVAVTVYRASASDIGVLSLKGVWDALSILYVVLPALLLYQVAKEAGTFDVIRRGIEAYTPNDLLHVLAFGWVFSSFLQGITGFGVPGVVAAPLLVAVGVKPAWAVVIVLIGHAWANTFGTLAVAWEGLVAVVELDDSRLTASLAALMLAFANVAAGLLIAWFFGRWAAIREALPAVIVIGMVHGLGQWALAPVLPTLAAVVPGTAAVAAVLWLAKTRWYRGPSGVQSSPVLQDDANEEERRVREETEQRLAEEAGSHEMSLTLAMSPYIVLIGLILAVRLVPGLSDTLSSLTLGLRSPRLETDRGFVTAAADPYHPLAPLTHAGTLLLIAALVAYVMFRRRGDIASGRRRALVSQTLRLGGPSVIAFLALIPLTTVMEGSGQTYVLAQGLAGVAPTYVYALLAPLVGVIGSFMTSSNLSSNILFGPFQETAASSLGVSESAVLAAQTAGAAVGNSVAPGNVLLVGGAVGASEESGRILRGAARYALPVAVALGGMTAIAAWLLR